jgi:hypothetical protein
MARIELAPEVFDDFDMAQFGVESAPARIGEITGLARLCRGVPIWPKGALTRSAGSSARSASLPAILLLPELLHCAGHFLE